MNKNLVEALTKHQTNIQKGLDQNEVAQRLKTYGSNCLQKKQKVRFWHYFLNQFKNPMIILLFLTALLSLIIAFVPAFSSNNVVRKFHQIIEKVEPFVIFSIIFLNAFFGAFQEYKSVKFVANLNQLLTTKARVIRNGELDIVNANTLVPGDVILLEQGDIIPADGIIIQAHGFQTNEAVLTGESVAIIKDADFESNPNLALGDKKNYVFSSTSVLNGKATVLITQTGMRTEIGKITTLLENVDNNTSAIEKKIKRLSNYLGFLAFGLLLLIFALFVFYVNHPNNIANVWNEGLKIAISVAIAVIPEGLYAIMTIIFALGIKRMIKQKALIKKIATVETLGNINIVCTDKTGTLTENKMRVVEIFNPFQNQTKLLFYSALCNDVIVDDGHFFGDAIDIALAEWLQTQGYDVAVFQKKYHKVIEFPFDSQRKMVTLVYQIKPREYLVVTKGAFESLIKSSKKNPKNKAFCIQNEKMTNQALRVIALAYKKMYFQPQNSQIVEKDLKLLALFGIQDAIKKEAKTTIQKLKQAGVETIMITGDHFNTAKTIGQHLGILTNDNQIINGEELRRLNEKTFADNLTHYRIYSRVNPEDKLKIVSALKQKNQVVAMIGDGINDAPALKKADVGCAMGINGSEVSKQVSDIVLTDDNFKTILPAIKEGRGIIDNLKRVLLLVFTTNVTSFLVIFLGILIFHTTPFSALQILWINLVTESFPSIALGFKKPNNGLMQNPIQTKKNLISKRMLAQICFQGMVFSALGLLVFYLVAGLYVNYDFAMMLAAFQNNKTDQWVIDMQTSGSVATFLFVTFSQTINGFNLISDHMLLQLKWQDLKYMVISFFVSGFLVLFVVLIPPIGEVFNSNVYLLANGVKYNGQSFEQDYSYLFFIAFVLAFLPTLLWQVGKQIYCIQQKKGFLQRYWPF